MSNLARLKRVDVGRFTQNVFRFFFQCSVVRRGSGIQRVEGARQLLAETEKLDGSRLGWREFCCPKPGLREFGGFRLKSMKIMAPD